MLAEKPLLAYYWPLMGSEVVKEGTEPFDHLQAGSTPTRSSGVIPGIPGENSRVVLSGFSATAHETGNWEWC